MISATAWRSENHEHQNKSTHEFSDEKETTCK